MYGETKGTTWTKPNEAQDKRKNFGRKSEQNSHLVYFQQPWLWGSSRKRRGSGRTCRKETKLSSKRNIPSENGILLFHS